MYAQLVSAFPEKISVWEKRALYMQSPGICLFLKNFTECLPNAFSLASVSAQKLNFLKKRCKSK